jgi:hypothetical protein
MGPGSQGLWRLRIWQAGALHVSLLLGLAMSDPIRFSHLRAFGRSAMHGLHARTAESEQTIAMERGTAVHSIVFGTHPVIGYPGPTRRGKEFDAFAALHQDYEILTRDEYAKAQRMAAAVMECKLAEPYLKGAVEETLLFRWMGLDCRSTPDVRGADFVTELKTAPSADPAQFGWHALRMHYHAQMKMEQIAAREQLDDEPDPPHECFIVCVEANEPHPVTVFRVDEKALEVGEKLLCLWAERLKVAEASQAWPPYVTCVVPLTVPEDEIELDYGDTDAVQN